MAARWITRCAGLLGLGLVAVGCGGEGIAERIVENRIESEGGGDVDIDFDDGDFSVKTEDGEFSIETDDDGNLTIEGAGGSDDESFTIQSDDGETVIKTDDGSAVFTQGTDLPDGFPDDVPVPDRIEIQFSQSSETADGVGYVIAATSTRSIAELVEEYANRLDDAGFERQQFTETPDGSILVYQRTDYGVAATFASDGAEGTAFQLTVIPGDG